MNVLVLGTSNAILASGWTAGLRDALPEANIVNRSVGASPGIQFATNANDDYSEFDFVILDTLPNDEEYDFQPGYHIAELSDTILGRLCEIIASQTRLVIIAIPLRRYFFTEESEIQRRRLRIAERVGADYINVRALLNSFGRQMFEKDHIYEHHAHPNVVFSRMMGRFLGEELSALGERSDKRRPLAHDLQHSFRVWNAADHGSAERLVTHSNRLLTETFEVVPEGHSLEVASSRLLVGFYINSKNTCCTARLSDVSGKEVRLKLFYRRQAGGVLKIFIPAPEMLRVASITVERSGPDAIRAMLSHEENPDPEGRTAALEISHITTWDGMGPHAEAANEKSENTDTSIHERIAQQFERALRVGAIFPRLAKG